MAALPENDRLSGPYIASAGQRDFAADFPLIKGQGLCARIERAAEVIRLTGGQLEAIDPGENGFTCRLSAPALEGDRIWIFSLLPTERDRSHSPNGSVRTLTLEGDAEELQAQHQEVRRDLGRAVVAPFGEAGLELPPRAVRAGRTRVLGSDHDGDITLLDGAAFKGDPGGPVDLIGTRQQAVSMSIGPGYDAVRTIGYHLAGDGGAGLYRRVSLEPGHLGKFQSEDGSWWELSDGPDMTVAAYGGGAAGIDGMAGHKGFVKFPAGETRIEASMTIEAPMYFEADAYVTLAEGVTVSVLGTVSSPRQWIFRGPGQVVIPLPTEDRGEDVREVYARWFGAVTQVEEDQAPAIQRAIDALGNSREGIVIFDQGSYRIDKPMFVGRGVKIKGAGTRRTVFEVMGGDYAVFTTRHTACFFEDIQFENLPKPSAPARTHPYIHVKHDFCELRNIFHQSSKNPIIIEGPNCKVSNVEGVYGGAWPGAGSAQVLIRAAGVTVQGVYCRYSSSAWPDAIVEIGTGATGNITAFNVENIEYVGGSVGVLIHGDGVAVARGMVRGINCRGVAGQAPAVVMIRTSATGEVFSVPIRDIIAANTSLAVIVFKQDSTGSIRRVSINDLQDAGASGDCIRLEQTQGSINNIIIGSNVETPRVNDVVESITTRGGVFGIKVAIPGRRKGKTASFTVPYSGIEDGVHYHVQTAAAVTVNLPNNAEGSNVLSFAVSSTEGVTLAAEAGGTVNGFASVVIPGGRLTEVAMVRNAGGSTAQWMAT
nr:glycosyl hydrolase family 28-related protein [Brevundimonas diminuta]